MLIQERASSQVPSCAQRVEVTSAFEIRTPQREIQTGPADFCINPAL
jgi:hypothetical protein